MFEHFPTLYNTIHNFNKTPNFFNKTWQNITKTKTLKTIQTSQDFYKTCANLYKKKVTKHFTSLFQHKLYNTLQHFANTNTKTFQKTIKLHNFVILFWNIYICYKTLKQLYNTLHNTTNRTKTLQNYIFSTLLFNFYKTLQNSRKLFKPSRPLQQYSKLVLLLYNTIHNCTKLYTHLQDLKHLNTTLKNFDTTIHHFKNRNFYKNLTNTWETYKHSTRLYNTLHNYSTLYKKHFTQHYKINQNVYIYI